MMFNLRSNRPDFDMLRCDWDVIKKKEVIQYFMDDFFSFVKKLFTLIYQAVTPFRKSTS